MLQQNKPVDEDGIDILITVEHLEVKTGASSPMVKLCYGRQTVKVVSAPSVSIGLFGLAQTISGFRMCPTDSLTCEVFAVPHMDVSRCRIGIIDPLPVAQMLAEHGGEWRGSVAATTLSDEPGASVSLWIRVAGLFDESLAETAEAPAFPGSRRAPAPAPPQLPAPALARTLAHAPTTVPALPCATAKSKEQAGALVAVLPQFYWSVRNVVELTKVMPALQQGSLYRTAGLLARKEFNEVPNAVEALKRGWGGRSKRFGSSDDADVIAAQTEVAGFVVVWQTVVKPSQFWLVYADGILDDPLAFLYDGLDAVMQATGLEQQVARAAVAAMRAGAPRPPPKLAGFLVKKASNAWGEWQVRWFEVRDGKLLYWQSPSAMLAGNAPRARLDLHGARLAPIDSSGSRFNLVLCDPRGLATRTEYSFMASVSPMSVRPEEYVCQHSREEWLDSVWHHVAFRKRQEAFNLAMARTAGETSSCAQLQPNRAF